MNEAGAGMESPAEQEAARNPVDELADLFVARLRRGERPSVSEYCLHHPDLADEIRELFPTLAMLEQAGRDESNGGRPHAPEMPTQLGEYRILGKIGHGGMGVVYEAEHATLGRRVALKVIAAGAAANPTLLRRFHREARAAGRLHHTNIVPVFEVGESSGVYFYAMQYIRGQSLDLVIEELRRLQAARGASTAVVSPTATTEGPEARPDVPSVAQTLASGPSPTPADGMAARPAYSSADVLSESSGLSHSATLRNQYFHRVARIGLQVAEALDHAHGQGILHRDIKPANLILDTAGVVWVTDFGLAKNADENLTGTGDVVGTLRYLAPERLNGRGDARSDLYGLGLTLFELCTLQPAFPDVDRVLLMRRIAEEEPPPPRTLNPGIPRDLETLILKAIDRQPGRRYPSARALADDLRLFLADRPVLARRTTTTERAWRWCRRNPMMASLGGSLALLATIVFIGAVWFGFSWRQQAELLADQTERARQNATLARRSETDALRHLYQFSRTQAEAARTSGRRGQRAEGLKSIGEAMTLLPRLDSSGSELAQARLQLRNDAIACMARVDVKPHRSWTIEEPWTPTLDFDSAYQHYAHARLDGEIVVRRVKDDSEVARFPSPGVSAWRIRFSPDGRYLTAPYHAPRDATRRVTAWEVATGREAVLETGRMRYGSFAYSPDSRYLAIGMFEQAIHLYDLEEGKRIEPPIRTDLEPFNLSFSPDGDQLAYSSPDQARFEVVNLLDRSCQKISAPDVVYTFEWGPDGKVLAGGTRDGTVYQWETDDFTLLPEKFEGHRDTVIRVLFNHRGDRLVTSSWDSTIRFWDVASQRELLRTYGGLVQGNQFSADDRYVGFTSPRDEFGIWELLDTGPLLVLTSEAKVRNGVEFSRTQPHLLVAASEKGVEVWDSLSGRPVANLPIGETVQTAVTTDGTVLFTAGPQGLRRWPVIRNSDDPNRWSLGGSETLDPSPAFRVRLADDGRWAIVNLNDKAWALDLEQPASRLEFGPQPDLHEVAVSPDGRWVATTSWAFGRGIQVWDRLTGQLARDLGSPGDIRPAGTAAFSPDGTLLATVSMSGRAVWRVGPWEQVHFVPHDSEEGWPGSAVFSFDNRMLALPFSRRSVQLVDPLTGRQLAVLEAPEAITIGHSAFSPDATRLAIAVDDQIQLWDLRQVRQELARLGLDLDLPTYPPQ
jgi:serine/threonine protein kinase/WD40 repeat protein